MKKLINKTIRRRDPIARDLLTPKYRQRVERNRKREAKGLDISDRSYTMVCKLNEKGRYDD
jgi:hypothetical protein